MLTRRTVTQTYTIQPRNVPFTVLHLSRDGNTDTVFLYQSGGISYVTPVVSTDFTPKQLGQAIALCLYMHGTVHTVVKDEECNTVREHKRTQYTVRGKPAPQN